MSWTTAILHLFSQETDLLMKVIMKCVNIKLWDILGCFHYILNAPRIVTFPYDVPSQVWYLIVSIPDLCLHLYLDDASISMGSFT